MIYFDIETTGLNCGTEGKESAEISKIEAIKCADNAIIDRFSTFVRCKTPMNKYVVAITGITDEMVSSAPDITFALNKFKEFIGDDVLTGYNTDFDFKFLNHYGEKCGVMIDNETKDLLPHICCLYDGIPFDERDGKSTRINNVLNHFGIPLSLSLPEKLFLLDITIRHLN